ncbi:unnamed protein product [Miscanthus lutarioriparius]|uniref:Uncharacterized protein n=1 Tax=Miscanthus lutarioriparius TaxID=422564 RepID=A0A811RFE2_9POAL|nr:unnamed protein product [Miscanthus lutarioriparius]
MNAVACGLSRLDETKQQLGPSVARKIAQLWMGYLDYLEENYVLMVLYFSQRGSNTKFLVQAYRHRLAPIFLQTLPFSRCCRHRHQSSLSRTKSSPIAAPKLSRCPNLVRHHQSFLPLPQPIQWGASQIHYPRWIFKHPKPRTTQPYLFLCPHPNFMTQVGRRGGKKDLRRRRGEPSRVLQEAREVLIWMKEGPAVEARRTCRGAGGLPLPCGGAGGLPLSCRGASGPSLCWQEDIGLSLDDITISDGFDEINDPNEISMLIKQRNGVTVDNEPPVEEHEGIFILLILQMFTQSYTYTHIGQEKYKAKAIELNGPDFDWLHSSVDPRALYECTCGRPHGKWATFNGTINDREVLADLKRGRASIMAARHQRQEEEDRMRKEASDGRLAKEYAQNMLNWARMAHTHNENMQKFMESVALQTGMPLAAVPPLMPPPPQPPTYAISPTPNLSPENVGTFGSSVRTETPDETISRIARVEFHSHADGTPNGVDGTASGGGTYSPPDEAFPFF